MRHGRADTALTASPTNFSTNASNRSTTPRIAPSRSVCRARTSSGSSRSEIAVNPDKSANSTVADRRSASATSGAVGGALAQLVSAARTESEIRGDIDLAATRISSLHRMPSSVGMTAATWFPPGGAIGVIEGALSGGIDATR